MKYIIGLDIGSRVSKGVLITSYGKRYTAWRINRQGPNRSRQTVQELIFTLSEKACLTYDKISFVAVTGNGFDDSVIPGIPCCTLREVFCSVLGAYQLCPFVRAIIDAGAKDIKVIRFTDHFEIEKIETSDHINACLGLLMERTARLLHHPLCQLGELAAEAEGRLELQSDCSAFIEEEIKTLLQRGEKKTEIAFALQKNVIKHISNLVKRSGITGEVMLSGGMWRNRQLREQLSQSLGLNLIEPEIGYLHVSAFGAAMLSDRLIPTNLLSLLRSIT